MSLTGSNNLAATDASDRVVYDTLTLRRYPTPAVTSCATRLAERVRDVPPADRRATLVVLAAAALNAAERLSA